MSIGAEEPRRAHLPAAWERLERIAGEAAMGIGGWRGRALQAEEEVARLRRSLEDLAADRSGSEDVREELRRLKAENAALKSRMVQARQRLGALLRRLATLGVPS